MCKVHTRPTPWFDACMHARMQNACMVQVVESLRNNEDLKSYTMKLLDESEALSHEDLTPGNKKKILDDLRKELE